MDSSIFMCRLRNPDWRTKYAKQPLILTHSTQKKNKNRVWICTSRSALEFFNLFFASNNLPPRDSFQHTAHQSWTHSAMCIILRCLDKKCDGFPIIHKLQCAPFWKAVSAQSSLTHILQWRSKEGARYIGSFKGPISRLIGSVCSGCWLYVCNIYICGFNSSGKSFVKLSPQHFDMCFSKECVKPFALNSVEVCKYCCLTQWT